MSPNSEAMHGLSVCMIVRDEERCLARALESVHGLADQLVVVDTGSTDRTIEIARTAGAEVFSLPWPGSFAVARNHSIGLARCPWVLVLDADEWLDDQAIDAIQRVISVGIPGIYSPRIRSYTSPECIAGDASEHYIGRLFPNHLGVSFVGVIHEQLQGLQSYQVPDLLIHHDGYTPGVISDRGKNVRNLELINRCITDEPGNPAHWYNLAQVHGVMGDLGNTLVSLRRCISLASAGDGCFAPAWVQYLDLADSEEAPVVLAECPVECESSPDYWATKGRIEFQHKRFADAEKSLTKALSFQLAHPQSMSYQIASMTWIPLFYLAQINWMVGRRDEAYLHLLRASEHAPGKQVINDAIDTLKKEVPYLV
jgi:glycosyltransferase involved in cell wall biosynthesis